MANRTLTTEELAALDAQYVGIPSFARWPQALGRPDVWERHFVELSELKGGVSPDVLAKALDVTVRAAAFDTGAIEGLYPTDHGLTITVATEAALWENAVEQRAPNGLAFFEAQLKTYELVLDAATKLYPVNEAWIRRLYEELTAPQETYTVHTAVGPQEQPLPRGEYKRHPNHVRVADGTVHAYAPVDRTRPEMERLVGELTSEAFATAHPVVQASYAHYALVVIHPFADGNGRVARALASAYLYRAISVPLLVLADQRDRYFRALRSADRGERRGFVEFVEQAGTAAMGMVAETIRTALSPPTRETIDRFRALMTTVGGLSHQQLDAVAAGVIDTVRELLTELISTLDFPAGVNVETMPGGGTAGPEPPGFRHLATAGGRYVVVTLSSASPAEARIDTWVAILASTAGDEAEAFRLQEYRQHDQPRAHLTLSLTDASPALSVASQHRLRAFLERVLGTALDELLERARAALEKSGYAPPT